LISNRIFYSTLLKFTSDHLEILSCEGVGSREQRAESKERRAESREHRAQSTEAESREQRAESREQRAESREQRAESREQRAESREQRGGSRELEVRCWEHGGWIREQGANSSESREKRRVVTKKVFLMWIMRREKGAGSREQGAGSREQGA
jgi:hypothetical protein